MSETIVVAGATGRVGGVVAGELLAAGVKVRILVRDARRADAWRDRGAEVAVGSLNDRAAVAAALRGARGFFTLLPEDLAAADFAGHRRRMADAMAQAVSDAGVPRVVFLSAIAAVLPEGNGPARELHHLERALAATSARVTCLRACYLQDNVAHVLGAARHAGIYPSFLPADAPMPMVATPDVGHAAAEALLAAAPARSEIVDLFGPTYTAHAVAAAVGVALGKTVNVAEVPPAGHVGALVEAGLLRPVAEAVTEMYAAFAAGKIAPQGDRAITGTTTLGAMLKRWVVQSAP